MEWIADSATAVLVGSVAAFFSSWLALKKFYRERHWEKRLAAYSEIMNALHQIRLDAQRALNEELENRKIHTERRREIIEKRTDGLFSIRRAADIGELLISKKATLHLRSFLSEKDEALKSGDWVEGMNIITIASEKYLTLIRTEARRDLNLRWHGM